MAADDFDPGKVGIDLFRRPWVLSKRTLLTEKEFTDELGVRGSHISDRGLEALHEHSVLAPWLRVERDVAALRRELRSSAQSPWHWEIIRGAPPTRAPELVEEWQAGRVADGIARPFEPWRRRNRRVMKTPYRRYEYLYSPYQLLLVPEIVAAIDLLGAKRPPRADALLRHLRQEGQANRLLLPLLTELEFVYYSDVRRRPTIPIGSADEFDAAWVAFDEVDCLQRSGWTADRLLKIAERLLVTARGLDPLRDWVKLTGLVDSKKWDVLRGSARVAIDLRTVAEMLLRFLEDLSLKGAAEPVPDTSATRGYHPLDDRMVAAVSGWSEFSPSSGCLRTQRSCSSTKDKASATSFRRLWPYSEFRGLTHTSDSRTWAA